MGNPIRQIEEAIFLLRRLTLREWLPYLLAAVPMLLALLQLARDTSTVFLMERCAMDAFFCAGAFFWASAWKARFGATLLAKMNGPGLATQQGGIWRAFYIQSIWQTLKLLVFPIAAVSILPLAWTILFFRNVAIEAGLDGSTLGSAAAKSARRAGVNTRGSWAGMFVLGIIGLTVMLNVYTVAGALPFVLRMFTGIETSVTRNIAGLFTFNVFCVVLALTWLVMDPLMLSYAAVRCFYTEARTDGRDLLARLRPIAVAALLFLAFIPAHAASTISKDELSSALHKAEKSKDYAWLSIAEVKKKPASPFVERLNQAISDFFKTIDSWWSDLRNWLRRATESNKQRGEPRSSLGIAMGDVRWLLYALAGIVLIAALTVIWRSGEKSPEPVPATAGGQKSVDLKKDNVLASDLPEEEWLRMARELLMQGETRLAVRAMYLANLSYLGSLRFIHIARAKSNAIYERELRRRPNSSTVAAPFCESNRSFERVWYGFHEVTQEVVEEFQQNLEAIRQNAKA